MLKCDMHLVLLPHGSLAFEVLSYTHIHSLIDVNSANFETEMKRAIDLILSAFGLAVFGLPLIALICFIAFTSKGAPIYWSERVGVRGELFLMPKLRTMFLDAPLLPTHEISDAEKYITSVGRFLRRTSLDELPQLYSVLTGDMSLVGPRPMIPQYEELLDRRRKAGVDMLKPGITGWAQVNGRDTLTTSEKLALDIEYLNRQSLRFDCLIMLKTIIYVFSKTGVKH